MLNADRCARLVLLMKMSAWHPLRRHPLREFYRLAGILHGAALPLGVRLRTRILM
jgi:hypothetical protein